MTTLRTAAQQALEAYDQHDPLGVVMEDLRAALAEPVQEPVPSAWRYKDTARICDNSDKRMTAPPGWVPLYSAPPQRKPLTDGEIINIGKEACAVEGPYILPVAFARAIEWAHGIGGKDE